MKRTRFAAAAATMAAALVLTGCGGDDGGDGGGDGGDGGSTGSDFAEQPADDVAAAAIEAMSGAQSTRLEADIANGGNQLGLDLALDTDGNCEGSVSLGEGTAEVVRQDGQSWFRADEAFWRAQAGAAADQVLEVVGDKWVVDERDQFSTFCDLDELISGFQDNEDSTYETDGTEDVDGQEAVKLLVTNDQGESTALIATEEPHYILQIQRSGEQEGTATFSDFDEDLEIEPPAEDDVVTLPGS